MTVGTRSVLFGVHQFLLHPIFVLWAWIRLYGLPSRAELIAILVHDWGYWGCPNMDGIEGERHPLRVARLARVLGGRQASVEVVGHSRHLAKRLHAEPSRLCYADKLGACEPNWLYLPRAWLSGELYEYRRNAAAAGLVSISISHWRWYTDIKACMRTVALTGNPRAVQYCNAVDNVGPTVRTTAAKEKL